ncbi:hypothetical protein [Variovorax paradoxus]|uniref:hypothetical protein n=1 Tax=Variovorax paradoxus TaxID=34073 RepID=UPI003D662CCE
MRTGLFGQVFWAHEGEAAKAMAAAAEAASANRRFVLKVEEVMRLFVQVNGGGRRR